MNDITLKIIFLGESGVGNTSIINRYVNNSFNPHCGPSGGASYVSKKIVLKKYNLSLQLNLWDTGGGHEKYRGLKKTFYPGTSICILVYDITFRESFESLKDFWVKNVQEYGGDDIEFGIAGNKCDLYEKEMVVEREVKEFAESINAIFHLTSCKLDIGINDLIEECVIRYIRNYEKANYIKRLKKFINY